MLQTASQSQTPSTSLQTTEYKKDVIVIYFSSGNDPFGKGDEGDKNEFVCQLYKQLRNRVIWININNYTNIDKSCTGGAFVKHVEGIHYNNGSQDYTSHTEDDIKSLDPKFDYDFLNEDSRNFYSKWLEDKITREKDTNVIVIDGLGGLGSKIDNEFCVSILILEKIFKYKSNPKVNFFISCSCCTTARITKKITKERKKELNKEIKKEEIPAVTKIDDKLRYHVEWSPDKITLYHIISDNNKFTFCHVANKDVNEDYVKEAIKNLNLPETKQATKVSQDTQGYCQLSQDTQRYCAIL